MSDELRVLMLEDVPTDAELNEFELRKAGFSFTARRVATREAFLAELSGLCPDLILADYALPSFDGLSALKIAQNQLPQIPFILISGTVGEEIAVESLKLGATDYVLKQRLDRLGLVVQRALKEAEERRRREQAEAALERSKERLRALVENISDAILMCSVEGLILYESPSVSRSWHEVVPGLGQSIFESVDGEDSASFRRRFDQIVAASAGAHLTVQCRLRLQNGAARWVEASLTNLLELPSIKSIAVIYRDVSERKQAETALLEERNLLRTLIDNLPDYVFTKDRAGRFVLSNLAHAQAVHRTPTDMVGTKANDVFPSELAAQYDADDEQVMQADQGLINVERVSLDTAGHKRWMLTTKVPLHDEAGRVVGLVGISRDITDRQQTQTALVEERNLLRTLIDVMPDFVYTKDRQSRFTLGNPAVAHSLGAATPDDIIGTSDFDFHAPDKASTFYAEEQTLMQSGQALINHEESIINAQTGSQRWLLTTKVPHRDVQGQIVGLVGINRDITDRKQVEQALEQERNLLRTLIDTLPDFVFVKDTQSRYLICNVALLTVVGLTSAEQVVGKTDFDLFPPDLAATYFADEQKVMQSGQPMIDHEERVISYTGAVHWVLTTQLPLRDKAGRVVGLVGVGRNITERKRMEDQLRRSEAAEREQRLLAEAMRDSATALAGPLERDVVLRRILDNLERVIPHETANIMLIEGETARIAYWRGYTTLGEDFIKTFRLPLTNLGLRQMLESRAPLVISDTQTYPGWQSSSATSWIRSYASVPIQAQGQVIGFLNMDSAQPGFFTDRHADILKAFADQTAIALENAQLYDQLRQHAAQLETHVAQRTAQLNEVKERVEAILNSSNDAILVLDTDGAIRDTNPAFEKRFAHQPGEAVGQPLSNMAGPSDVDKLAGAFRSVVSSARPARIELIALCNDGQTFDADLVLSPILGSGAAPAGVVCSVRDITDYKRLEAGLRRALEREKDLNELKSRFISMASHEFRTPLTTILGSTDLLALYFDKMSDAHRHKHFEKIQSAVKRVTQLLDDVLLVGKAEAGRMDFSPTLLNISVFCRELVEEAQTTFGKKHTLVLSAQGQCGDVVMDSALLRHIIGNLLSNAVKYSPLDSLISFDLECTDQDVIVRIQDAGIGIPEQDRQHLFEPFHRASNVKTVPGTGLGLAIVKQAVEAHHGTISFHSELGVGTTFTVSLPVAQ